MFYAYAAPEPDGFSRAAIQPPAARYDSTMSEYFLPYESVRRADSPERELTAFLETSYDAGAALAGWNRKELERPATKSSLAAR